MVYSNNNICNSNNYDNKSNNTKTNNNDHNNSNNRRSTNFSYIKIKGIIKGEIFRGLWFLLCYSHLDIILYDYVISCCYITITWY